MLNFVFVGDLVASFGERNNFFLELFGLPFIGLTTEELTHEFAIVVKSFSE